LFGPTHLITTLLAQPRPDPITLCGISNTKQRRKGEGRYRRPKKSAAYPRTGGRCARSGEEATADRPSYVQPSTAVAAAAIRAPRRRATKPQRGRGPGRTPHDHQPDHEDESREPETSEHRSGGIERRAPGRPAFSLRSRTCFSIFTPHERAEGAGISRCQRAGERSPDPIENDIAHRAAVQSCDFSPGLDARTSPEVF
jgi:hypothetical protein